MSVIESAAMGNLLFQGKVSRSDTIVFKDHMNTRWWIKSRNCINIEDLDEVFAASPAVVAVGLGFRMPISISDEAVNEMKNRGIEVFVGKTDEAVEVFNKNVEQKTTVGLFHLI